MSLTKKEWEQLREIINHWPNDGDRIELHRVINRELEGSSEKVDHTFDRLMQDAKESRDPYRTLAAHVLSTTFPNVSPEDRHRFKQAFYVLFHLRGPDIIKGMMEDLRELDNLPEVREWLRRKARET